MKNIIFSLFALSIILINQLPAQTSFLIGAAGGVNLSKYRYVGDDDLNNTKNKFGLGGGLHCGIEFGRLAILTGASYLQRGTKNEFDLFEINSGVKVGLAKVDERIGTIQIPLMARYRIFGEGFGVNVAVGPAFNLALNGNYKVSTTLFNGQKSNETTTIKFGTDTKDEYKSNNISFLIQPSFFMAIGEKGKLNFDFIFDLGASDMLNRNYLDDAGREYSEEFKQFSNAIRFGVTYEHRIEFGDKY